MPGHHQGQSPYLHNAPDPYQPSEHSRASSALIGELIPRYLDPKAYAVVQGSIEETTKLLEKPYGHSQSQLEHSWSGA